MFYRQHCGSKREPSINHSILSRYRLAQCKDLDLLGDILGSVRLRISIINEIKEHTSTVANRLS